MALNDIVFIKGQGGLGRPLEGEDYISSLLFYSSTLPSGFSSTNRIKAIGSVSEAEALGINNTYSDATAAVGTYLVSNVGATGDTINISVNGINTLGIATTYDLGTYTKVSGDSTAALVATAIGAVINQGTINHGFSATVTSATVSIVAPKRFGVYLNTGSPIVVTIVGTIAGTITQFSAGTLGTISNLAVQYYHISEFFRVQPKGLLYVGIYGVPSTYNFVEIQTIQDFAGGKIRQIGVFKDAVFSSADLTAIQAVCTTLAGVHKPLSAIYAGNIKAVTDLTTLADLATLTANNVSAVIGQDGAGQGNYLYVTQGKSITCLGATLGAVAFSKVSEDIAWISKYNMSSGTECDTVGFANGQTLTSISQSVLNLLDNRRYIFLIKYVGISGSYYNDSHCAVAVTSDYAYIENNRTIDKAIRGVYSSMLPNLNSPLVLNSDGTLTDNTVAYFTSQAAVNLDQMVRDTEVSAFSVTIDPSQNVLTTSTLYITIKLVPIGVARNIVVNIGFTISI